MRITHLGLTPLKGMGHSTRDRVAVEPAGLVGDRVLALTDAAGEQVLRTVDHPGLTRFRAHWDDPVLVVRLPDGRTVEQALDRDTLVGAAQVSYWHHRVPAELYDGAVAHGVGQVLGSGVRVARTRGRRFRWADPVSVVFRSEVLELARRTGRSDLLDQPSRWRCSAVVDDGEDPVDPAALAGHELRLGGVGVRVTGEVDRCAVIDTHPATGERDVRTLAALAAYRRTPAGIHLGVRAEVVHPGVMALGDVVTVVHGDAAGALA